MTQLVATLEKLDRRVKVSVQLCVDCMMVFAAFTGASFLRLKSFIFLASYDTWIFFICTAVSACAAFYLTGVYRSILRSLTGAILIPIGVGSLLGAVSFCAIGIAVVGAEMSITDAVVFGILLFLLVGGARFAGRAIFRTPIHQYRKPAIIYGAGDSGLHLLNSLFHGREYSPVAFVDDDERLQGLRIGGLRVHAADQMADLLAKTGAQVVLLAIPSLRRDRAREIVSELEKMPVKVQRTPRISEIINGTANVSDLRAVQPEDLLGREPIEPKPDLMSKNIAGCTVLVSGAGGSIGSELCKQIAAQRPRMLVLLEMSEFALYSIESELSAIKELEYHATRVVPVLGSAQDSSLVENIIKTYHVRTIYHAAAYKHVPIVEENVSQGVLNNVFGTLNIATAASELGVENFIFVSTDKAVRPTNIMGATKRIGELVCQALASKTNATTFSMVRFGNVLGSSGSVVPRFRAQIEAGGPVTVTHRDVTRYFMSVREAAQLVIQAGAMSKGGDVFVLDMGEPVKIFDLANKMIRLHDRTPYEISSLDELPSARGDIPIYVSGLRKGEKLYEELLIGNASSQTVHPRIMTASEASITLAELYEALQRLQQACGDNDVEKILDIFRELPLEYSPTRPPKNGAVKVNEDYVQRREAMECLKSQNKQTMARHHNKYKRPRNIFSLLLHRYFLVTRGLTLGVRAIVLCDAGSVLLVRHSYTQGWHFPGGGVEKGQTPERALESEILQETGLKLQAQPQLHGVFHNSKVNLRDHVLVYVCKATGVIANRPRTWEILEARYFAIDDLPDDIEAGTARRIREVLGHADVSCDW